MNLSPAQERLCREHLTLLKKWNQAFNLTAITDEKEMWIKHTLDSLAISPYLPSGKNRFLDVGTGGGFPGVPLAILHPESDFFLLDTNGKKIRFLMQVKIALKLKNIFPVHARVESFQTEVKFDGILSRAFASAEKMIEQAHYLLNEGGAFYAMKGPEEEPIPAGYVLDQEIPLEVPGLLATRGLWVIRRA